MSKHTPGPWYADKEGHIWRRDPADLYENGGTVAGDKPLAFAAIGWPFLGDMCGEASYPLEANAHLIAASPELYEALKAMVATYPYSPPCLGWEHQVRAHQLANAALHKAEGQP